MKPVYLTGRALASVLGLSLNQALANLRSKSLPTAIAYPVKGHGDTPYQRIPVSVHNSGWNARARALITQVVADAGAAQSRQGALFIATSCQDGDTAESTGRDMDFHALSRRIGDWLDWRGPVFLISSACTSSMQALLSATEWLRTGSETEAVVLGVELDNRLTLPGFAALQLLSPSRSKPFALQRDGLVLGEAVAALRLSTEQTAPWQLRGGANVVNGTQPNSASAAAVTQMCQLALAASGLMPADVDLIKVQAAGSPGNDASEAEGLLAAFANVPALVSLKPLIGHCMGASGAAEIALLLECLEQRYWPRYPDAADPALGVQLATLVPEPLRYLLTTILGFGGSHAAMVLERSPL
jgi:3-oxoacyl-[acyl-carrier-protein] synthase-1